MLMPQTPLRELQYTDNDNVNHNDNDNDNNTDNYDNDIQGLDEAE